MTTLDIKDEVYNDWVKFYNKQDKLKYPTLKNFTARKLRGIIEGFGYFYSGIQTNGTLIRSSFFHLQLLQSHSVPFGGSSAHPSMRVGVNKLTATGASREHCCQSCWPVHPLV